MSKQPAIKRLKNPKATAATTTKNSIDIHWNGEMLIKISVIDNSLMIDYVDKTIYVDKLCF